MLQKRTTDKFMKLPKYQRLMRFLKDNGAYANFIRRICSKHSVKFGEAVKMIIENPDIPNLIGIYGYRVVEHNWYISSEWDNYTQELVEKFDKYNPYAINVN